MPTRTIIPYDPELKSISEKLRNESTLAEILLWNQLKQRQMRGYQFLRQKPLDRYIVDFFSYELMLAIEIDGESHAEKEKEDQLRQRGLESFGIRFLRFYDNDVKQNMAGVLYVIEAWVDEYEKGEHRSKEKHPSESPLKGRLTSL